MESALVDELDATDAARHEQWASTRDYLTAIAGERVGHGGRAVRFARALADLAATREALGLGRISRTQAEVTTHAVGQLPGDPTVRARGEALLLEHAVTMNATDLERVARHLVEVADPDGAERKAERDLDRAQRTAHRHRFLVFSNDGAGGVHIKGRASVEDAVQIKTALASLAAPQPAGQAGSCGGTAHRPSGDLAGAECAEAGCAHDGRDPRDHGARMLDALVEACRRLSAADVLPQAHGVSPRLNVTLDYDTLRAGLGEGRLDTGETLSATAIRRMACDAEIIPTVLGTLGEVLDVGRTRRLVTAALWKALVVRDRHCAFPGCTRPPTDCDAHHIRSWLDGGATSLFNLVLMCRTHHTVIHTTPWQVRLNPVDQRPEFLPPTRLDPQRRPIRRRDPRAERVRSPEREPCPR